MSKLLIEIGNPMAGTKVVVDHDTETDDLNEQVLEALNTLKETAETWRSWSLENETKDEKRARIAMEENAKARLAATEEETRKIHAMLRGES